MQKLSLGIMIRDNFFHHESVCLIVLQLKVSRTYRDRNLDLSDSRIV